MRKLQENKVNTLNCANCNAPLVEIMVTRPDEDINFKMQADCPHCGDKSFIKTFKGGFHYGSTEYTTVVSFGDLNDEVLIIKTAKGEKAWK